jgi:hypothetical protein
MNQHGFAAACSACAIAGWITTAATWAEPVISCGCGLAGIVSAYYAIRFYRGRAK